MERLSPYIEVKLNKSVENAGADDFALPLFLYAEGGGVVFFVPLSLLTQSRG